MNNQVKLKRYLLLMTTSKGMYSHTGWSKKVANFSSTSIHIRVMPYKLQNIRNNNVMDNEGSKSSSSSFEFEFELARTFVLLTSTKTVELFNEMLISISFAYHY